jgi:hypothetical protein
VPELPPVPVPDAPAVPPAEEPEVPPEALPDVPPFPAPLVPPVPLVAEVPPFAAGAGPASSLEEQPVAATSASGASHFEVFKIRMALALICPGHFVPITKSTLETSGG